MALRELGYTGYRAYLASSHWRSLKARYRASDQPQDCICGSDEVQLHHTTYERIGAEYLTDLTPLCPRCHTMIHVLEQRGELGLDFTGFVNEERAKRNEATLADVGSRYARERRAEWQPVLDAFANLHLALDRVEPWDRKIKRSLWQLRTRARSAEKELLRRLPT